MNTHPEKLSSTLISRLSKIQNNDSNEFELASIERDAKKLLRNNADEFYMIFGIISGIKGNYAECKKNFTAALNLLDDDIIRINYALSLSKLGRLSESYHQIIKTVKHSPDNIELHKEAIEIAYFSGHIDKVIELYSDLVKFKADISEKIKEMHIDSVKLSSLNISENYTSRLFSIVEKICLKNNMHNMPIKYLFDFPGKESVCCIETNADASATVDINMMFCEELINADINTSDFENLSVLFRAAS